MIGVADHSVLLWVLLPLAVLVSGVAPSMISFVAGQAAFTVVVIILFNIIEPVGWRVGLTRIEDVAIGCGVSIVVGPPVLAAGRHGGARARAVPGLRRQLGLPGRRRGPADHDLAVRGHRPGPGGVAPRLPPARRRLPPVLRRAGRQGGVRRDDLPPLHGIEPPPAGGLHPGHAPRATSRQRASRSSSPSRSPRPSCGTRTRPATAGTRSSPTCWTTGARSLDLPLPHGEVLHHVLRTAFDDVRAQQRVDRVQTTLQMLWADELLENQSQMQADLLGLGRPLRAAQAERDADLGRSGRAEGGASRCTSSDHGYSEPLGERAIADVGEVQCRCGSGVAAAGPGRAGVLTRPAGVIPGGARRGTVVVAAAATLWEFVLPCGRRVRQHGTAAHDDDDGRPRPPARRHDHTRQPRPAPGAPVTTTTLPQHVVEPAEPQRALTAHRRAERERRAVPVQLRALRHSESAPGVPSFLTSPGGPYLYDANNRVVLLHGVNVVYKHPPYIAYPDPGKPWDLSAADAARMQSLGFNVVRLGIEWQALEPGSGGPNQPKICTPGTPGDPHEFNRAVAEAYLGHVAATVKLLSRYGIYTLLDMHQDVYNTSFRGEGAPDWAVCTDDVPIVPTGGRWSNNYSNPQLDTAVHHFWTNDVVGNLQGQYDLVWATVAQLFQERPLGGRLRPLQRALLHRDPDGGAVHLHRQPGVLLHGDRPHGFLANGASPLDCPPDVPSNGVIPSIQAVDHRHLIFVEPDIYWVTGGNIPSQLGPMPFQRVVFNFHVYCGDRSPITGNPERSVALPAVRGDRGVRAGHHPPLHELAVPVQRPGHLHERIRRDHQHGAGRVRHRVGRAEPGGLGLLGLEVLRRPHRLLGRGPRPARRELLAHRDASCRGRTRRRWPASPTRSCSIRSPARST